MEGFKIFIDDINMQVKLVSVNDYIDPITSEAYLYKIFERHNIVKGIDKSEILRAFIELYDLDLPAEYIVACGKQPEDGKNGELVFQVDMTNKAVYFAPEDDDAIASVDYKKAIGVPFIRSGECLCEITRPEDGIDGYDVHGKILSAKDGVPVKITLGYGVSFSRDRRKVIAQLDGRPQYKDDKLFIDPVYEIRGDVSYETGNINFNGHVLVLGSVLDDFSIDSKSVEIKGNVGNSFISCQEDVFIYGGVNGRNSEKMNAGHISCGGNLMAKYLNDVSIEAKGDVRSSKGIVNSTIQSYGRVYAHKIMGGEITALKGIEIDIAGSEIGTPTIFEPGVNYRVKYYNEALTSLSWQIDSIIVPLKKYLGDNEKYKHLTAHIQKRILSDYEQLEDIYAGYLEILDNKEAVVNDISLVPVCEVVIHKKLNTDVKVLTSSCHKTFMYDFDGPIILKENLPQKSIMILNYTEGIKRELSEESDYFEGPEEIPAPKKTVNKIKLPGANKVIYTKYGVESILKLFHQTIHGQNFLVFVFEDRNFKRMSLINELKRIGIKNVFGIKDEFEALEVIKENEDGDKKLIIICNLHVGQKAGLKFVTGVMHQQSNSYGIFLAEKATRKLIESINKVPSLAIFHEDTDVHNIAKKIKDFGFSF